MIIGQNWTATVAKAKIQRHYNQLAAFYNAGNLNGIADLYLDTSTIYAPGKKARLRSGKAEAVKFWKARNAGGKKSLKFKVDAVEIRTTFRITLGGSLHKIAIQTVAYAGTFSYVGPQGDPIGTFAGSGDHLSSCSFDGPDFETFTF
jgi:hypothetical protein